MGYYPIKCIRCAHVTDNEHVLFNTKDVIGDVFVKDRPEAAAVPEPTSPFMTMKSETVAKGSIWDDDDEEDTSVDVPVQEVEATIEFSQYMTCSDIEKYCEQQGFDRCQRHYQHVDVTPDFAGRITDLNDLLTGLSFQKEKNGKVVKAYKRICPHCHCELPSRSGSMPTYNVTVMGTSASGKTVYLSALNWLLAQSQGDLPYRSSLTCLSANKANQDFVNKSNTLFEQGLLPGTTQIVLTEPLVVEMTYRLQDRMKRCLIALADMRGEDLVAQDGENLLARGEFFARADAFMVLVSPMNMQYIYNSLPNEEREECNSNVHQTLMSNISEYILPFFQNGVIAAPTVVMMSKCDVLMNNAARLAIPLSNAVVAAEPPIKFTGTYFAQQNRGTQTIMQCDQSLFSFLKNTFPRTYFTSFSSLGRNIVIEEGENSEKKIQNPNAIRPIRVVDPIIYILISLGFLPDFSLMELGQQYTENNIGILNRWIAERT